MRGFFRYIYIYIIFSYTPYKKKITQKTHDPSIFHVNLHPCEGKMMFGAWSADFTVLIPLGHEGRDRCRAGWNFDLSRRKPLQKRKVWLWENLPDLPWNMITYPTMQYAVCVILRWPLRKCGHIHSSTLQPLQINLLTGFIWGKRPVNASSIRLVEFWSCDCSSVLVASTEFKRMGKIVWCFCVKFYQIHWQITSIA